ncbi:MULTISPECIES: hypothetical protein [Streptomyces]|uniref:hypothetical protein n=1 Tax=Streptomyces TaxID=1883 RepID=UPI0013193EE5|nr:MULTISPECIES: hypothetical protein [Streptomyces]QGZ49173.1 hypothetical protein GPZ77_12970 [Streptomyces sp. QHH-9511]
MGIEAHAGFMKAYIFAECVSPQLKGSQERPARIRGTLNVGTPVPSDTVATREANLTVLHSVALAVVKKLGCENNAGLPDKPVLKAKSLVVERHELSSAAELPGRRSTE